MSHPHLSVVDITPDGADTLMILRAGDEASRFFPPLLAAQLLLDVRGLVHQDCFSRPVLGGGGRKNGAARAPRRWALAQEIFSNNGRGTESGHFLEHLVLELALQVNKGRFRRFAAETSWDFRVAPDLFHTRFFKMSTDVCVGALDAATHVLSQREYRLHRESRPAAITLVGP